MSAAIRAPAREAEAHPPRAGRGCACNSEVTRVALGSLHAGASVIGSVGLVLCAADPTSKIGYLMFSGSAVIGIAGIIVFIAAGRFTLRH